MGEEKTVFAENIKPDDQFDSIFLCQSKSLFTGKTGKPYLSLTLIDKSGSVDAKVWDNAEQASSLFSDGDYVKVRAKATTYNGNIQLRISRIKAIDADQVNPEFFFPTTSFDVGEMLSELRGIVESLENENIRKLLLLFLDDEEFLSVYKRTPAAKNIHHPFLGGLLEHTLSLMNVARLLCSHYEQIDFSMLAAGVFLHDIGKTRELEFERGTGYSDEGRLVGHITIGIEILNERIAQIPDFPEDLKVLLKHMILAHHGTLEFGSPKRPKIIEAHVLSVIDDLDARMNSFSEILAKETKNSRWTTYQRLYDRYLYRWQGPEIMDDSEEEEAPETPDHRPTEKPSSRKKNEKFSNAIRFDKEKSDDDASENLTLPFEKK